VHVDELGMEHHLSGNPKLVLAASWHWIRKMQARYLAGEYAAAADALSKVQPLGGDPFSQHFEGAEFWFYGALSHAASWDSAPPDEKLWHSEALKAHQHQLDIWARDCPETFENRATLVRAEIARIQGRELEAERLYEQAIRSAHENGFVHNEGLAYEVAARFYAALGFETFSNAYLQNARACYVRWGADGKVRQMDLKYPHLAPPPDRLGPYSTLGTPVEQLDLTTVLKVSQVVAGEIEFNRLIKILMHTALEHAGAERGLLILPRGAEMWIEAEATTAEDRVQVWCPRRRIAPSVLAESVLNYVVRTRDSVLLDDATEQEPFSRDEYVRRNTSRSILCLPLVKQTQLIGVLYLENDLATHVFTAARIALLRLVASQAATALENARLYSELRDAEVFLTQAQRLSLTGSFCWRPDTDEITFSEELYRIFAFEQASAVTLERIIARVHPEDVPLFKDKMELARKGGSDEHEIRLRMPGGSDKHLRTITHVIRDLEGRLQCVGAVQDVTQHRLAEEALSKARSELAHASRMTSIGALTASIAHEITQPLAAIVSNADSCLIWLANNQPNLDKARRAAERIVKDGHRAAEVIQSIRAQARRSASEMVPVDLNRLIVDTLELMQAELQRHEVLLETRLLDDLALIKGDHTQLQQVIVNLVTNAIEAISTSRRSPRLIRVSTESNENGDVLTIIEDSGAGIDLQVLDRIFDPMFTTKPEGMGLGLSICRSIVEGHGGRLWVSPNPAGGSIFQFSIPDTTTAVSIEAASAAAPAARHAGQSV
jgi:signal transduction histidine kinase